MANPTTASDAIKLLQQALDILDDHSEHVAAAYTSEAIAALDGANHRGKLAAP
ncbi:hypothetical protein [Sphingomonas sp. UV9]|uniref:hypothetical protein n=1 Tax=Sphingomonas sp. UV9 TaxID=1851410 RepID=UPI0013E8B0F7|nr:hypothetical protein [Sphingomonas sp. UV9]